ncbi:MAG: hypothetical protein AMXMBFR84_39830 [Candidatus Hydrogenedentota bacterium]
MPLLFVLFIWFYIATESQSAAVRETLVGFARTTTAGIRQVASMHLETVETFAKDQRFIAALMPRSEGQANVLEYPQALEDIKAHIVQLAGSRSSGRMQSILLLYDSDAHLITESEDVGSAHDSRPEWKSLAEATYVGVDYLPERDCYVAQIAAPIFSPYYKDRIGYISEIFDISELLAYTLGRYPGASLTDTYQVLYRSPSGALMAARFNDKSNASPPELLHSEVEAEIARRITESGSNDFGNMRTARFLVSGDADFQFLAWDRLFPGNEVYVAVSRSAASVYKEIFMWAGVAIATCLIMIAFMTFNAYRNVHNNIVRPVLLLNEGAQIIGQGDLDLKLKIGTGDEIEQLAMSFNKMALALKRNIMELEESEEKYRSLVTSMRDGIFQTDRDGVIGFLNPAGAEIFGFAQLQEALGLRLGDLFHEKSDLQRFRGELDSHGFVERSRVWMRRRDGRSICVELSGNLVHDDRGESIGTEGIFRDVTKNVRLEQEARDRAERLSAINQIANVINSSLEAGRLYESLVVEVKKLVDFDNADLALLDEDGEMFRSRRLWPEHEERTQREYRVDDPDSCSGWVARNRECLLVDDIATAPFEFGDQFPEKTQSCICVPLYATGRIIGTMNLGAERKRAFVRHDVDVLEQMAPHVAVAIRNAQLLENLQVSLEEVTRAREKLHEANEELKTLDEMKTNLLSNVSHELRTPLVAVMGYTDMIFNGKVGPVNDTQREYLEISLRNIEKLVTLIENLLDFSRLHRGTERLVFDSFDLTDCARASLQIVKPVADSRDIKLELIAPDSPVEVEGDKGKMGQVFNNLLSNAVKFNCSGGRVTVELRLGESSVEAIVSDTGIGIPKEALDKVFTRFYQYDSSSTRKYGGTGIGLSIAQDIARLHGSRITVSSELGSGATFRFTLPLRGAKRGAAVEGEDIPKETHLLIELVTPDRSLSAQVRNLLVSEGMDVIHAGNVTHAIALCERHAPDCLLVDVEGDEFGQSTLDGLLAHPQSGALPIIILTGDEALYERYRSLIAARVKRGFRKSALLSGVHYALNKGTETGEPLGSKILCVDDDQEIVTFVARCLEPEGYTVEGCASGDDAISRLRSREYGLVLLDIAMPGMDGWETCRRIKSEPQLSGIRVHFITAKPIDSTLREQKMSGADGYLMKPFRPEDLIELVHGVPTLRFAKEA